MGREINNKKRLIRYIGLSLIMLLLITAGFVAVHLYCQWESNQERTYTFNYEDYTVAQDGIWVEYETLEDKVWDDKTRPDEKIVGAQYDFYLHNDSDYKITDWSAVIEFPMDFEWDSSWNVEDEVVGRTIVFTANVDGSVPIKTGARGKTGWVLYSEELMTPGTFTVTCKLEYSMLQNPWTFVLASIFLIWLVMVVSTYISYVKSLHFLAKQAKDASVINGLASMFNTMFLLDLETGRLEVIKDSEYSRPYIERIRQELTYDKAVTLYLTSVVDVEDTHKVNRLNSLENLKAALAVTPDIAIRYRTKTGDGVGYYLLNYLLLEDGRHCAILFKDVDEETKREMDYNKQLELAKEEAEQANAAKSDFLSRMSHEIRTPMNAIVGIAEILQREELTDKQREYLSVIRSSGNALLEIINDILDFSKIEAGRMELSEAIYSPADLFREIQMILRTRIGDKPVDIKLAVDPDLPEWLYGDELRLRQVIINLGNNSIKFTEKGHVELGIHVVERTAEDVAVRISVKDTGIGIKEEDMDKLYGAFEQLDMKKNRKKEGTGLGLAISKQLVELLGGDIQVESTYGEGTTFYFTIRQKLSGAPEQKPEEELRPFTAPEAHVLVVDDNEINRFVIEALLEIFEMKLDLAASGEEAIQMAEKTAYDLIFMDHMMPDMDGVEAMQHIKDLPAPYGKAPVYALTASATVENRKALLAAGMDGFLSKPVEMKEMQRTLMEVLPADKVIYSDGK